MHSNSKTDKRVAIVTGAASGIARATAERFAKEGIIPVIVDMNIEEGQKVADALGSMAIKVDITSYEECCAAAKKVFETYGRIDILVNCVGGHSGRILNMQGNFADVPISRIEFGIKMNLMGTLYMTHAVIRHMIDAHYGKIINLGSVAGVVGAKGGTDYSTSKGGIFSFTKSLAMEVAKEGINVCCVSPGPVLTRPAMAQMKTYFGRVGKPEEIASLINYLCSDEAAFITGHNYVIDGGRCFGGLGATN
ncbi:MAG: SDR family oxidoreductase [Clostridia bacterium]|nr:SDR family oxidoreductase [Clostridia bacterium]